MTPRKQFLQLKRAVDECDMPDEQVRNLKLEMINWILSEMMGSVDIDRKDTGKERSANALAKIFADRELLEELKGRLIRLVKAGALQTKSMEDIWFTRGRTLELQILLRDAKIALSTINKQSDARTRTKATGRADTRTDSSKRKNAKGAAKA